MAETEGSENIFETMGPALVGLYDEEDVNLKLPEEDKSSDEEETPAILNDSEPEPEEESDDECLQFTILQPSTSSASILPGVRRGRDGTSWSNQPSAVQKTPRRNIFKPPKSNAVGCGSVVDASSAFKLFFTDKIIQIIVDCTNAEGRRQKGERWISTDRIEIEGLIGLYIHLGAIRGNGRDTERLWWGLSADVVSKASFSRNRFVGLSNLLRFDDKETRSYRREKDIFAPFRNLWDEFQTSLKAHYIPGPCLVVVDEQLVPWRGRVKFLQYLPSKPDKYGLKIFWVCDAQTAYPLKGIPYLEKYGERKRNLREDLVLTLCESFTKSGRNVTCDNFFTTLPLVDRLATAGMTLVGTVRRNKAFLPPDFKTGAKLKKYDSDFAYMDNKMLVTYKSNTKKNVILLSSMHSSPSLVPGNEKRKPDVVDFYNATKGGVDILDQMCHSLTTKRKCRRWPMICFYNLIDVATVAAVVIWRSLHPGDVTSRADFNENIAKGLLIEQVQRRSSVSVLKHPLRGCMGIVLEDWTGASTSRQIEEASEPETSRKRGRCSKCPRKKDVKTRLMCLKCRTYLCTTHAATVCKDCISD